MLQVFISGDAGQGKISMAKSKALIWILLFCFFSAPAVQGQSTWELQKTTDGISVYTRALSQQTFKEIKIICELPGTPAQLLQVLRQVERHPEWVYLNRKTTLLQRKSENRLVYHTEADMPWPLTDRDMVVEAVLFPETKNRSARVEVRSVAGVLPEKPDFVRIPFSLAIWDITALPNKRIKVEYTFQVHPGGSVPAWAVNATVATGPITTFQNLRKVLAK